LAKVPAGHETQPDALPAGAYVPGAHATGAAAGSAQLAPAGHETQNVQPGSAYVPAAQAAAAARDSSASASTSAASAGGGLRAGIAAAVTPGRFK
jgi:hypothetical protein